MLEVTTQDQPLVTSVRPENAALPTEPDSVDHGDPMFSNTPVPKLLVSTPHEVNVGGFGRLAQAIMLVDQILKAFSLCDVAARLSALHNINTSLQSFLGMVVKQHSGKPSSYCSAVVIAIRYVHLRFTLPHNEFLMYARQITSQPPWTHYSIDFGSKLWRWQPRWQR